MSQIMACPGKACAPPRGEDWGIKLLPRPPESLVSLPFHRGLQDRFHGLLLVFVAKCTHLTQGINPDGRRTHLNTPRTDGIIGTATAIIEQAQIGADSQYNDRWPSGMQRDEAVQAKQAAENPLVYSNGEIIFLPEDLEKTAQLESRDFVRSKSLTKSSARLQTAGRITFCSKS